MKRFIFLSLSLSLLLILIPGCFTFQAPASNPGSTAGMPPVIIEFSNSPSTVSAGGTSTLMWNVTGARSVSIDQGIGQVDPAGTRLVSPNKSTVYTINAINSAGTVIRTSAIIFVTSPVIPPQPPNTGSYPNISFTASSLGGTSWQLNWDVSNATLINIQPDLGPVGAKSGAVVTVPSGQTKMYKLEAVNDYGYAYRQVVLATP